MNERVAAEEALAVSVPGGELIGVRSGSGRPLLVLHGGPAVNDYSDWFAAELAGWEALRYTQRGVTPSVAEGPFTIEQHVSDALAVLDQHGVAAATVLGHSWGGYLAMQLAARAPGRVTALVLADPLGAVGDGGLAGFGAELTARATPESLARIAVLDELQTTSAAQAAAVALEYFRLATSAERIHRTGGGTRRGMQPAPTPGSGGHGGGVPGRAADHRAGSRASGVARGAGLHGCGTQPDRRPAGRPRLTCMNALAPLVRARRASLCRDKLALLSLRGEVPVVARPGGDLPAGAGGRGHLRAAHADREQVILTLKAAFVQGMLAKDEFDLRVAQTFASRTYAELAAVIDDLPPGLPAASPRVDPQPQGSPPVARPGAVLWAATGAYAAAWVFAVNASPDGSSMGPLLMLGGIVYLGVLLICMAAMAALQRDKRSGGQPPRRPGPGADGR